MCNCCNTRNFRAVSYTYTAGSSLVINTESTLGTLHNNCMYTLAICTALPAMATVVPVFIRVNDVNIPVLDVIGNTLFSDQIHNNRKYSLVYGTNPSHFKMCQCGGVSSATPSTTTLAEEAAA